MKRFGNIIVKAYMAIAQFNEAMAQFNDAMNQAAKKTAQFGKDIINMMKVEDPYLSHIPTSGSILFYEKY